MTIPVSRKKFTVKEYYKMAETGILKPIDRVELLDGDIITMSPIKSKHAGIVTHLLEILILDLAGKATILSQSPISISDNTEPEPDLVIAKFKEDRYRSNHPKPNEILLLIEVSDSTLLQDRKTKKQLYAKANIPEYWIFDVKNKQVEVFRNIIDEKYTDISIFENGNLKCQQIDFSIDVEKMF